jgi:hypothetical protein
MFWCLIARGRKRDDAAENLLSKETAMPEGFSVSLYSRLFAFICGCFSLRLRVFALMFGA